MMMILCLGERERDGGDDVGGGVGDDNGDKGVKISSPES